MQNMPEEHLNRDYTQYTFDDFLQDDFFISSIKNPTEESLEFWCKLEETCQVNVVEYNLAKEFICSMQLEDPMSDTEELELWDRIVTSNQMINKKRNKRRQLAFVVGIAACIAIVVFSLPYITDKSYTESSDILNYAAENRVENIQTEIQLILSKEKTIQLTEESDIAYDSTEIKVSEKGISKNESAAFNQLLVPRGRRSKLTLADGTKMYVNSGTRVVYPIEFAGEKREIYVDGEIFIEVHPDSKRPFIVRTSNIDVQVLGTKFNVMAYESDKNKQVVLASGSVKILARNNAKDTFLSPTQMYEYSNGKEHVETVDVQRHTSWIKGLYYFDGEKLEVIIARLSRYYGVEINYESEIANLKCSGKLDMKDNLADVLNGLAFTLPIKVEYNNESYNLIKTSM